MRKKDFLVEQVHIHLPVVLTQLFWTNSAASSFQAYLAWGEFPVITTVSTTALPIEELPWPSFTICNQVLVMVIVVVVMVMIFGDGGDVGAENNWCPGSRCRSNRKGL